jgi:GT2 family glycosyltransferase
MCVKVVLGIITYNRVRYLNNLLNSFIRTRNNELEYILIIADDGSTDGSILVVEEFIKKHTEFVCVLIKNNRSFIAGQTNSILLESTKYEYDYGFMVNDDVEFMESGWDKAYIEAMEKTKYYHLVYYDKRYASKKAAKSLHNSKKIKVNSCVNIVSKIDYKLCMGCFWTFNKKVIEKVGFFNTQDFHGSGYSHIEYTLRACRAGFNSQTNLYDVENNKIKVFCEQNDNNYNSVKDNMNIKKNKEALNKTIKNVNFIYFGDNIYSNEHR